MRKYIISFLVNIMMVSLLSAGSGRTGWSIYRRATSPKLKSITVTPVMAVRGDLSGVFYNPAILALNTHHEIFLLSELGMLEDKYVGVVYGHPLKDSSIAGGFLYYNTGEMLLSWIENNELKTEKVIGQQDLLALVAYGRMITKSFAVGGNIKFATSSLFRRASAIAIAADLGVIYTPPIISNLSISGAIQNIGTTTKFLYKESPLPFSVSMALGYMMMLGEKAQYYINPGIDVTYFVVDERTSVGIGIEGGIGPVFGNIGYKTGNEGNWQFGIGYLSEKFDIAYGFQLGINLNSVHRLSIGYRF